MKKFVLFSLLFLSLNGLYAMEEGGGTLPGFSFANLPDELLCMIARFARPDQESIAPEDAVQDVAGYGHGGSVLSVVWSPDGTRIASGGDGRVKIANPATGEVQTEYGHEGWVRVVAWSPDGTRIVSGGGGRRVKIANPATGEVQTEYGHRCYVRSVAWSPDSTRIASGGDDGVKIVNPATGEVQTEYGHEGWVRVVAWSPDGTRIASGGGDDRVKIANPATGEVQTEYRHGGCVFSVAWSPDGTRIASGGNDRLVKIANPATGEVLAEYGHEGRVESVAWSPDSTRIASGGGDGRVKIKSVVPLLLATHQLEHPTLSQYLLLKRLQESLLRKKVPLVVGQSDRNTLEEMSELKKLLRIETNELTKDKVATLWRLQLRGPADFASQGGGIPAAHAGGEYAADLEEEEQ